MDYTGNEKLFYTIGEVAHMFSVEPSLLRFWEKEFPIINPQRNERGIRKYTKQDIDNIREVFYLVKERGMTLGGAKQKLKDNPKDINNSRKVVEKLRKIKEFLTELKKNLG